VFLKSGDEITVSIAGIGSLTNKIASSEATNYTVERIQSKSSIPLTNLSKTINGIGLTKINDKSIYYERLGVKGGSPVVFVHGLGGTSECWKPLISTLSLANSHDVHLFDLEGHGLSPTSPLSTLSISSFAADLKGVFEYADISSGATVIAHSMGCLIALSFAINNPGLVKKLILLGPPPSPLPEAASKGSHARATIARTKGMVAVVDAVVTAGTSEYTKSKNPLAIAAIRLALMGQDPEGYAKACSALAGATQALEIGKIMAETFIITGDEDKVSPPQLCEKYTKELKAKEPVVLKNVGHWHVFEDVGGVCEAVKTFL
jgi:pimeloyl-ACP methyl ester carboxylesterase